MISQIKKSLHNPYVRALLISMLIAVVIIATGILSVLSKKNLFRPLLLIISKLNQSSKFAQFLSLSLGCFFGLSIFIVAQKHVNLFKEKDGYAKDPDGNNAMNDKDKIDDRTNILHHNDPFVLSGVIKKAFELEIDYGLGLNRQQKPGL